MSDQLAISATLSVLMMSIYVLFGADAARLPVGPDQLQGPAGMPAPGSPSDPGPFIGLPR